MPLYIPEGKNEKDPTYRHPDNNPTILLQTLRSSWRADSGPPPPENTFASPGDRALDSPRVNKTELQMQPRTLAEIKGLLAQADWNQCSPLHIAVLRNISIDPILPYWEYEGLLQDAQVKVSMGGFDQIVQEATQEGGMIGPQTGVVVVFPYLPPLAPNLVHAFPAASDSVLSDEQTHLENQVRAIMAGLRKKTQGMVLWHSFETPAYPARGVQEDQHPLGQIERIGSLNAFVRSELERHAGAYIVNMDRCRSRVGADAFYDRRLWQIARGPYSLAGLQEIAREDFTFIRALRGKNAKCLVVDCDNTLWGGIVGEDGIENLRLGQSYPGNAYLDFQREIVNLHDRGILVALCSKNNESDVWEVFDRHPDMLLKRHHLAAWRINWLDKAANLRALAAELNIGIDSIVFADDSEFEIDLVRDLVPEVHTLHLPPHAPHEYAHTLASCRLFDTLTTSEEDRQRTAMYQAEVQRQSVKEQSHSLADYLCSLEMVATVSPVDTQSIKRAAQLTQKTNQFNLTTRRYTEEQIQTLATPPASDVYLLRIADRFGDAGIVGVCVLLYTPDEEAVVDSFLLSCRVLGRAAEDLFLLECLRKAKQRGARTAIGEYVPTAKNGQVAEFYVRMGFRPRASDSSGDGTLQFERDLTADIPRPPEHFLLSAAPSGGDRTHA